MQIQNVIKTTVANKDKFSKAINQNQQKQTQ